jgi:hypothetical protein
MCSDGHRLVSRSEVLGRFAPHVAQCLDCSLVFEATGWQPRVCGHCGLGYGESLHDPCLGTLEGVVEACCGHGDESRRYVSYADGRREGPIPDRLVARVVV